MTKKLLEKYEENHVIRAIINLVPNIGGSLDILLSSKGSLWREERIKKLLSDLDSRIGELENPEHLNKIAESEEFYDLIVQSLGSVAKTRHKEKIKCYSNILVNNLIQEKCTISSEILIAVLDIITLDEIKYLSEIKNNLSQITFYNLNGYKIIWPEYLKHIQETGRVDEIPNSSLFKFDIELIWKLLVDKNLITKETKEEFAYLQWTYSTSWQSNSGSVVASSKTTLKLTEFGEEFIKWVIS